MLSTLFMVELSLHTFRLLDAGVHGIHHSGTHALLFEYFDCLDGGTSGRTYHIFQLPGMFSGLQHHFGTAEYGLTAANKRQMMTTKPYPEIDVTQEMRQVAFDNWETTDDHGMVIYGIAKDQNGKEYFMVKNSWGKSGKYNGIWYASKAFVAYKTMNILVHKDALPKEIAKKLGIK